MGTAEATGARMGGSRARAAGKARRAAGARITKQPASAASPGFGSANELKEVLGRVLTEVDGDRAVGPLLRAAGLRMRMVFPDLQVVLNVGASEEGRHHLRWRFADEVDWEPKLELRMVSAVANRYLQGRESLAIAIARGKVRCTGEARTALLYVPATRLIVEPYRRIIQAEYPHLAVE
jgi:hypothetical protein